jgi:geranylgeranyl pyrophosphate synthase
MTSQPGKDFRTKLTAAFNDWLRVPEEQLTLIGKIVQMLHNASLLSVQISYLRYKLTWNARMDDVEDDAQMRRGMPGQSDQGRRRTSTEPASPISCAQDIWHPSNNKYRKLCLLPGVQGAVRPSRPK